MIIPPLLDESYLRCIAIFGQEKVIFIVGLSTVLTIFK